MADLIALPYRASDATFTLVSDATAYFYEAGTSTPLTVYTDSGLGTPRGTSVAADSEGVFAQCWVASGTGVKVDVKNAAGTSLPGFPQDYYPTFSASGTGANSVTFSAITGNSATDAQTAIANETARNNTTDNAEALATSGGSGGTFTLTSTYTISAYAAGMEYEFVANQASVGSGSDTLNVDSVGAVVIKKYANTTTKTDLSAGEVTAGDIVRVKHDGTHFVLVSPTIATTDSHGLVEAATTAEMTAGTAEKFPDAAKVKAWVGTVTNKAILAAEYASGTAPAEFNAGSWAALELNTERYDGIGVSLSSNQITFANAGTYRIFAHITAQNTAGGDRSAQLRVYNATQTSVEGYGNSHNSQTAAASFCTVDTVLTVSASDAVEIQGRASGAGLDTYSALSYGGETGLQVTIERLA